MPIVSSLASIVGYGRMRSNAPTNITYYYDSPNNYAYFDGTKYVWYGTFVNSATPGTDTFNSWAAFLRNLPATASRLQILGTYDATGKTMTTNVSPFIQAMKSGVGYSISSDGATWYVNTGCTTGSPVPSSSSLYGTASNQPVYISWNVSGCTCGTGYMIRPHIQNLNWGGINSSLCGGLSQYMSCIVTL